jgi:autotransporter translocation and assembly factor TamB
MNVIKHILRWILYATGGALLGLLVLAGVTQTQFFRDRVRSFALAQLDSVLTADVELGGIDGNLVTGFSINGITLSLHGDTLLHADQLSLRYDLFALPGRSIAVHDIVLYHPRIHLTRSLAGRWNVDEMVRPTEKDTSPSPFDWPIIVRRFEIRDGVLFLTDSLGMREPGDGRLPDAVRYSRMQVRDLNLALAFQMQRHAYQLDLTRLSLAIAGTPVRVRQLSGVFALTAAGADVRDMRMVTDSSRFALTAGLRGADLLGGVTLAGLRTCSTLVDLHIDRLNLHELGCLIPETGFLDGTVDGTLQASGRFGALRVHPLDLRFGSSRIQTTGSIANLDEPSRIAFDVEIGESVIDPADLLQLMPGSRLPDFRTIGPVTLKGAYKGTPQDFTVKLAADSRAGGFRTDAFSLRFGGPRSLQYDGTVRVQRINLAALLDQRGMESNINGRITVKGFGTVPVRMNAVGSAMLDSSTFRRLPITRAQVQVTARDRNIDGTLGLTVGPATVNLEGHLDSLDAPRPVFGVHGVLQSLNLEDFLNDSSYVSNLNCTLEAQGAGISLATIGGDLGLTFSSSSYRDYPLTDGKLHLQVDQADTANKHIALTSPFVEASVSGVFDLDYLRSLLVFEVQNAGLAVRDRFTPFDSTLRAATDTTAFHALRTRLQKDPSTLHCKYNATVKDVRLLSLIFGGREFNGSGVINGGLDGNYYRLSSTTALNVTEFYYGGADSGMLVQNGVCKVETSDLTPDRSFATADVHISAGVTTLNINRTELDSLGLDLRINDRYAVFSARGALNQLFRGSVKGQARLEGDSVLCKIDSLAAAYDGYAWTADSGLALNFTGTAIRLTQATFRRGQEEIDARGALRKGGGIVASLRATGMLLDDLRYFLAPEEASGDERSFSGSVDGTMVVGGSADHPEFNATVRADSIAIRGIPFGTVNGTAAYHAGLLTLEIGAGDPARLVAGTPALSITGTIPLPVGNEIVPPDAEMDLRVRGDGAQINILDPLLPTFNQLTGTLNCDLHMVGTAERPTYTGTMQLRDCHFLFEPNNMYFLLDGEFQAEGDRIHVVSARIRNIPADESADRTGLVTVDGDFALRGFRPGDFNLSATGQLNVVKEATRKSSLSMYGDLFVEIGQKGLHFTGEIQNSLLRGGLVIRNSSLVFPPTEQVANDESALSVPIIIYDDTTRYGEKRFLTAADKYFGGDHLVGGERRITTDLQGTKSFLDGMKYDLDIEATGGSTTIRMVFNPISSEELLATIDGGFTITDDGRQWMGDLTVSRAYYNFYRRFDAEGRIRFSGDFMNPDLDITATYHGERTVQDTLSGDKNERIVVTIQISGPRKSPKLNMSMTIDEADYDAYRGLKSNDVQSDAIAFIIYGSFPLTTAQKGEITSDMEKTLRKSLLTGASSLLTGTLSEFLRTQTGFINSVELNFNASTVRSETADIRLSGSAWNGYWKYGGQILDDPLGNANFSLLYSFGTIFENPALRNFMIELESKVESGSLGQATDLRRTNSARVFYRFSF